MRIRRTVPRQLPFGDVGRVTLAALALVARRATPNSLAVVDLASMAVSTMKLAIDNSDVGMANGQAAVGCCVLRCTVQPRVVNS